MIRARELALVWMIGLGSGVFAAENVVVALKPDKDPDRMLAERKALADVLSKKLGKPVEVIVPLSSAVIIEGLANGSIDLGYLSGTDMVNARKADAAELLLAGEIDGNPHYKSYWVTLKEKPYASVEDLKGRPIAFASKTSTSGFVVPLFDLHARGLVSERGNPEEFFGVGNVWFGTGYVSAIERVFSGEAEAAAVSDYVLDADKHLTPEQRGKLRKIQAQGPVPTHVIAASAKLDAETKAALKAALLSLNDPADSALRDKVFTSKLIERDENEHLAGLRKALALANPEKP